MACAVAVRATCMRESAGPGVLRRLIWVYWSQALAWNPLRHPNTVGNYAVVSEGVAYARQYLGRGVTLRYPPERPDGSMVGLGEAEGLLWQALGVRAMGKMVEPSKHGLQRTMSGCMKWRRVLAVAVAVVADNRRGESLLSTLLGSPSSCVVL